MLCVRNLSKSYDSGMVQALQEVSLDIEKGQVYALMGPSGCGKSTLLNMVGALDAPTSGEIFIKGQSLQTLCVNRYRNRIMGFVFQQHNLLPSLTLLENVALPLAPRKDINRIDRMDMSMELLAELGIQHRASFYPAKVSGGERQRTAVARALVNKPELLLADEPTGSVDSKTAGFVMETILRLCRKNGMTVLLATHDLEIAKQAERILYMSDGKLLPDRSQV